MKFEYSALLCTGYQPLDDILQIINKYHRIIGGENTCTRKGLPHKSLLSLDTAEPYIFFLKAINNAYTFWWCSYETRLLFV